MSGTQEASCCISMIVAVFPFQFISCTPHTCNSSAINLVATKSKGSSHEDRSALHLYIGSQWLVCSNKFISCTLNTHITYGLRLAETGQWLLGPAHEDRSRRFPVSRLALLGITFQLTAGTQNTCCTHSVRLVTGQLWRAVYMKYASSYYLGSYLWDFRKNACLVGCKHVLHMTWGLRR